MFLKSILQSRRQNLFTIRPDAALLEASRALAQHQIGALLVVGSEGEVIGILSERDVIRALHALGAEAPGRSVRDFMTADPIACGIEDSLHSVMSLMNSHRIRHLPVTDGERVVAMVSIRDVVEQLLQDASTERDALREYITAAG